ARFARADVAVLALRTHRPMLAPFFRSARSLRSALGAGLVALALAACSSASDRRAASAAARSPGAPSPPASPRIEALLSQMTLEEKAGQLTQWTAQVTPTGPLIRQGGEDDIR